MLGQLFHISRPVLWINTMSPGVVRIWPTGDLWRWEAVPLLLWLTLPSNLLLHGVNDILGQKTDTKNPRKDTLEGAKILPEEVALTWRTVGIPTASLLRFLSR